MRLRYIVLLAAGSLLLSSASAIADSGFSATLSGAAERPAPVSTPGNGTATCILDQAGTSLSYTVTYADLLANRTASHFHGPATTAQSAGVVFGIAGAGGTSGTIVGTWPIDATNLARLNAGLLYINVHSQVYPGGEIRGQVLPDATPNRLSTWGRIKQLYR